MSALSSREIARRAVRDRLVQVTLDLVLERGIEGVTLADLAEAGGVSRSTYLRHVGSKDDAVVAGALAMVDGVAERLLAEPPGPPWAALRGAMGAIADLSDEDAARLLLLARIVRDEMSLSGALVRRRESWRSVLADALRERDPGTGEVGAHALAAAALACLEVAVSVWSDGDGARSLDGLLDESFGALGPHERG